MRKILFRGKDVKEYWHIGLLARSGNAWYISDSAGSPLAYEVIPSTVGQYTGLIDEKGYMIFEGDIVKEKDCVHNGEIQIYGRKWAIYFKDGVFFGYRKGYKDCVSTIFLHNIRGIERIGNIHDNPELLKEVNSK